ncbi:hypothetical protein [Azospirillum soli]|uniref:hypothetical protein n=1 Tax=Azospirillum soli TaxID=1304799 RepID=UPI001AE9021E|nr:hypothetical protein [Azospirillum soli]MBP2314949.1 hypothetical protein [Azospirillum soli]
MFAGSIDNLVGDTIADCFGSGALRFTGASGTLDQNGATHRETIVLSGADHHHYWRLGRAGADAVDLDDEQPGWGGPESRSVSQAAPMDRAQKPASAERAETSVVSIFRFYDKVVL